MPYLFVHFKEKITPDGEAVYYAISKDGFNFKAVNKGNPIIMPNLGEKGCRDIEIVRLNTGGFVIITTDLSVANRYDDKMRLDWRDINHNGSKCLRLFFTPDLVNFSEEVLQPFSSAFGCMWAPEVYYEESTGEYLVHWGSTIKESDYEHMSIYASTTLDFKTFTTPKIFFDTNTEILDSHIRKFGDTYHLFYKNSQNPSGNMHATSKNLWGPYENDDNFQGIMQSLQKPGSYEGPTTYVLPDGRWCLMLDYFGCKKSKMGYVPFVSPKAGDANFKRSYGAFSFPYGFKHGGVIEITEEEYERLATYRNSYNFPNGTGEPTFLDKIKKLIKK